MVLLDTPTPMAMKAGEYQLFACGSDAPERRGMRTPSDLIFSQIFNCQKLGTAVWMIRLAATAAQIGAGKPCQSVKQTDDVLF